MKGLGELGIFPILFVCTLDMSMNVLLLAAPAAGGEGAGQPRVKPRVTLRDPQPSSSHPASPTDTAVQHTTGEGNHCMTPFSPPHVSNISTLMSPTFPPPHVSNISTLMSPTFPPPHVSNIHPHVSTFPPPHISNISTLMSPTSPLLIYPISPPSCLQLSPRYPSYIQMHAKLLESVKVF